MITEPAYYRKKIKPAKMVLGIHTTTIPLGENKHAKQKALKNCTLN